jgi:hypothetical protein
LAGLKTGELGSLLSALCMLGMGRMDARVVFGGLGPLEVADSSQTVPVEVADILGLLRETGAPSVRVVGATLGGRGSIEEADVVGRMEAGVVSSGLGPSEATNCP